MGLSMYVNAQCLDQRDPQEESNGRKIGSNSLIMPVTLMLLTTHHPWRPLAGQPYIGHPCSTTYHIAKYLAGCLYKYV